MTGQTYAALDEFTYAIRLDDTLSWPRFNRVLTHVKLHELDKAETDIRYLLKQDPNSSDARTLLAALEIQRDDYDNAISNCTLAISLKPSNSRAYFNRAQCYAMNDDYCRAISDMDTVINLLTPSPSGFGSCDQLKTGALSGSLHASSISEQGMFLGILCGSTSELAGAYYRRAMYWHDLPDYDRALEDLNKTIDFASCAEDAPEIFSLRAEIHYRRHHINQAFLDCNSALKLDPSHEQALLLRASLYLDIDDTTNAMSDCNAVLSLSAANAKAYAVRAGALLKQGDLSQALLDADRALKLDPHLRVGFSVRGYVLAASGLYESAIQDLTRALKDHSHAPDPQDVPDFYFRGLAYYNTHKYPQAFDDLVQAVSLYPESTNSPELPDIYYALALASYADGKRELALSALHTAIQLRPQFQDAWSMLKLINNADN